MGAIPCFPSRTAVLLRELLVGRTSDLETPSGPVRVLQVMPITEDERALGRGGREALDAYFRANVIDPFRDHAR